MENIKLQSLPKIEKGNQNIWLIGLVSSIKDGEEKF